MKRTKIKKFFAAVSVSALAFCVSSPDFSLRGAQAFYEAAEIRFFDSRNLHGGHSLYEYQWYIKNKGRALVLAYVKEGLGIPEDSGALAGRDEKGDIGAYLVDVNGAVDTNVEAAWSLYEKMPSKREVTVAVIDTGIDIYHEDLHTSIWSNPGEIEDGADNDGNGYVDDIHGWNFIDQSPLVYTGAQEAHGTHEAGIIAAAWNGLGITGLADSRYVKLLPLRILEGSTGRGNGAAVKKAIAYARDKGADIVNLSMVSYEYDAELYELMKNSGMLFIIAAGNGEAGKGFSLDEKAVYPAAYDLDNIIAVANLEPGGKLEESSNFGKNSVDIAAPGTYILSTLPDNRYGIKSGTSMAAPVVTGIAALVYTARPDMDPAYLREALIQSSKKSPELQGKVASEGYIDALGAMQYSR